MSFIKKNKRNFKIDGISKFCQKKSRHLENQVAGPIDGLKNKARPSVRGWKSSVFCKPRQSPIHEKWTIEMNIKHNTTKTDGSFSDATIETIWRKAAPIPGMPPSYARDQCGAIICRLSYGRTTTHGWEIARDPDDLNALQPLQWSNNRGKDDQQATWSHFAN